MQMVDDIELTKITSERLIKRTFTDMRINITAQYQTKSFIIL